ncbi:hypothetical protein AX774_g1439 [Zancudomyces culisetae]|uniref:Gfd2/YDR514C-like C-terminal domain-containing protein n=1 Tax=Zancudomyces culisetae TaxID=1213189 RepID=A0A1R1PVN0_ZANCU|nr:hypothetical protein AX774_g1439 [Zancudomyces culisetae]|eukprot:OMH85020.1 hypothetical protein AX774_g1439 [Zancudomyces culisetae]
MNKGYEYRTSVIGPAQHFVFIEKSTPSTDVVRSTNKRKISILDSEEEGGNYSGNNTHISAGNSDINSGGEFNLDSDINGGIRGGKRGLGREKSGKQSLSNGIKVGLHKKRNRMTGYESSNSSDHEQSIYQEKDQAQESLEMKNIITQQKLVTIFNRPFGRTSKTHRKVSSIIKHAHSNNHSDTGDYNNEYSDDIYGDWGDNRLDESRDFSRKSMEEVIKKTDYSGIIGKYKYSTKVEGSEENKDDINKSSNDSMFCEDKNRIFDSTSYTQGDSIQENQTAIDEITLESRILKESIGLAKVSEKLKESLDKITSGMNGSEQNKSASLMEMRVELAVQSGQGKIIDLTDDTEDIQREKDALAWQQLVSDDWEGNTSGMDGEKEMEGSAHWWESGNEWPNMRTDDAAKIERPVPVVVGPYATKRDRILAAGLASQDKNSVESKAAAALLQAEREKGDKRKSLSVNKDVTTTSGVEVIEIGEDKEEQKSVPVKTRRVIKEQEMLQNWCFVKEVEKSWMSTAEGKEYPFRATLTRLFYQYEIFKSILAQAQDDHQERKGEFGIGVERTTKKVGIVARLESIALVQQQLESEYQVKLPSVQPDILEQVELYDVKGLAVEKASKVITDNNSSSNTSAFGNIRRVVEIMNDKVKKTNKKLGRQERENSILRQIIGQWHKLAQLVGGNENKSKNQPQNVCLVSIDCEMWERNQNYLLEIGWAMYDKTKGAGDGSEDVYEEDGGDDDEKGAFLARHYIIAEHYQLHNSKYVGDYRDKFMYGKSVVAPLRTALRRLASDLSSIGNGCDEKNNENDSSSSSGSGNTRPLVVILGHDLRSDLQILKQHGIDLDVNMNGGMNGEYNNKENHNFNRNIRGIVDTSVLFMAVARSISQKSSLINILHHYNLINGDGNGNGIGNSNGNNGSSNESKDKPSLYYPHNAGNDSVYVMKAFLAMVRDISSSNTIGNENGKSGIPDYLGTPPMALTMDFSDISVTNDLLRKANPNSTSTSSTNTNHNPNTSNRNSINSNTNDDSFSSNVVKLNENMIKTLDELLL